MRFILHADLDAFYAAVEQLDNPSLRGKPVLVGGRPETRGVVATASYEARPYGVHSAMPMSLALRRCPQGIIVRPRFDRYKEVSQQVMAIFHDLTDLVEPLSLDEAYLDITPVLATPSASGVRSVGTALSPSPTSPPLLKGSWGDLSPSPLRGKVGMGVQLPAPSGRPEPSAAGALHVAIALKHRVKAETGLDLSVGVGTGKSVAKIASDLGKPDGLVVVQPGQEREFLAPLPVARLWGIGPKTAERLHQDHIETIGQLADQPLEWFLERFGKRAASIRQKAQGQDPDPVHTERLTKSISAETTFPSDLSEPERLYQELARLAANVARHLERQHLWGKTVTVKLRLADFTTFTRQATLPTLTHSESTILDLAWRLLSNELTPDRTFRLLGVGVSTLTEAQQLPLPLFEDLPTTAEFQTQP